MISNVSSFFGAFSRLGLALLVAAGIASCSGAVSGPPVSVVAGPIVITPATATLYSNLPTTFVVTGGNGFYIITSSDQSVIDIAGAFTGTLLIVIPNPVAADTPVTITVRDTGTAAEATAVLTVKPRTVSNVVTITPSPSQPIACGSALCSGGDAEVKATLVLNGVPLTGHEVRFDVISGDFRIITSAPGAPETLSLSGTTFSDGSGTARMRIRANVDAVSQTGLIQITDVGSGAFQRTSFVIVQSTGGSPGFFVTPTAVTFSGPNENRCATSEASADFYIFGGTPPYTTSNTAPDAFQVSAIQVTSNGTFFRVIAQGQCVAVPGAPIVVRDSLGHTVTVTVANKVGTTATAPLKVSPDTVTLSDCTAGASVTVVGGTGSYTATPGNGSIFITSVPGSSTFTIRRVNPSPGTTSPVNVGISDGVSTATVTVNLTGAGATACPTAATQLTANPTFVILTDCTTNRSFQVSGGNPSFIGYTTFANGNSFTSAQVLGGGSLATFFVSRQNGAAPASSPQQSLTITDGNLSVTVPVNFSGAGAGICP